MPIPFRDYFGSERLDWAQSNRSQWYLRGSVDSYTTHNDLVQQATLPSTGLLTHNNYLSLVIANNFRFLRLLGAALFNASGLHLTQTRNSNLGFALAFPFSATSLTVSGFETFGDNQFATPITFFPSERNQEKYQFRYDLSDGHGSHALKFGVNFIHEPVLGGAFPANNETLYQFPQNPTYYLQSRAIRLRYEGGGVNLKSWRRIFAEHTAARILRARLLAHPAKSHLELRVEVLDDLWSVSRSGRSQMENPGYSTLAALDIPLSTARRMTIASKLPRESALPIRREERHDSFPRRIWALLQRSGTKRMGNCIPGG